MTSLNTLTNEWTEVWRNTHSRPVDPFDLALGRCALRAEPRAGSSLGAVAQLGERGLCKPEVVGSIPSSSTIYFRVLLRRDALALKRLRGALPLYKGVGVVMIFGSMDL